MYNFLFNHIHNYFLPNAMVQSLMRRYRHLLCGIRPINGGLLVLTEGCLLTLTGCLLGRFSRISSYHLV